MADTQITAYSDQYYFTRPDTSSYIKYRFCRFPVCKLLLRYFQMP